MPNAERAAKVAAALNKAFGEDFTFTARKQGDDVDLPRVADNSRPTFTAKGSPTVGGKARFPRARGSNSDDQAQPTVISSPRADFATAELVWAPVEGDLCIRVETDETFTVGRVVKTGFGRTIVYLTAKQR